jgi:hypothetical protein
LDVPILMIDEIWQYINQLPCSVSGIEEQTAPDIHFYPQPANEYVQVSSVQPIEALTLYALTGELIREQRGHAGGLSLEDLAAGLYLCGWRLSDGSSGMERIVKH